MEAGVECVVMIGIAAGLKWSVNNWDTQDMVAMYTLLLISALKI